MKTTSLVLRQTMQLKSKVRSKMFVAFWFELSGMGLDAKSATVTDSLGTRTLRTGRSMSIGLTCDLDTPLERMGEDET